MQQRNPTRQCLIAPICLAAFVLGWTCAPSLAQDCDANAKLTVGSATAPSGLVEVELRGSSVCEVDGFGLAIGHDPTRVEFVDADPGPFLVSHAGSNLFFLPDPGDVFTSLLVAFDLSPPLTVPPTDIPENTLLATLTYRILEGAPPGIVELRNETNTFGSPPTANIFTNNPVEINPVLESGVITIGEPQTFSMSLDATVDSQISLRLAGSSTKPLRGFSALLSFDPAVLSVSSGGSLADEAFVGTVWDNSQFTTAEVGAGTIELVAFRSSPALPVPAGVDLPFAHLTFDVLSCAGSTTIGFTDDSVVTNQFVDEDFGVHDAGSGLELSEVTVTLGGGGASGFIRGNANGGAIDLADPSLSVDLADAIFMLHSLFMGGQAPPCADAADANDDGRYNLLDPIWVIQFLIGNAGSTLPAPFTQPGDDPTVDSLGCDTLPGINCVEL